VFNQRLREIRLEKGLRQKDVADALGLTLRAICNYEAGTREPSLDLLISICKYLDVPADYLLGLTDGY
jgi:transcriptional regulator with XRE-family HTH domain